VLSASGKVERKGRIFPITSTSIEKVFLNWNFGTVLSKVYVSLITQKYTGSIKEQKNSRQILMQAAGRWTRAIRSTTALPPSENRVMNEAEIEKKQFDVRAIIEDAITSLRMAGLTNQGALKLLMVQSAIRMDNAADVREVMASIESGLVEDGDDGLRSI